MTESGEVYRLGKRALLAYFPLPQGTEE